MTRIAVDDPRTPDVVALLDRHLAFANTHSPPEDVHALDVDALVTPAITFCSARDNDGRLLAVGALNELDALHGELKSMHTAAEERKRGLGRAMAQHLLQLACERGYERVSLETGTMEAFVPARALYTSLGFAVCPPFADYVDSPNSVCMTLVITPVAAR